MFIGYIAGAHPFLAVSKPVNGQFLIVEGWVSSYAAREAKAIFEEGHYQEILTCGTPVINEFGSESSTTFADWGAARLRKLGLSTNDVQAVPAEKPLKDRTYTSALAVKDWLQRKNIKVTAIDVVSSDAHARRSRMLFQKAFGKTVKVGIIAVPNPDYDSKHWWRSSAGVREVLDETIAYLYALFFVEFASNPAK